jgi:hypothetical protein
MENNEQFKKEKSLENRKFLLLITRAYPHARRPLLFGFRGRIEDFASLCGFV